MTAGLAGDLALLAAFALIPAAGALFLLRSRLTETWPRFWGAMMYGLFGLSLLGVVALAWTASFVSRVETACIASGPSSACGEVRLWFLVAALPAIGALLAFGAGAGLIRVLGRKSPG